MLTHIKHLLQSCCGREGYYDLTRPPTPIQTRRRTSSEPPRLPDIMVSKLTRVSSRVPEEPRPMPPFRANSIKIAKSA